MRTARSVFFGSLWTLVLLWSGCGGSSSSRGADGGTCEPACANACKSDEECPAGDSCCDRSCIDVQSDSANCGACGMACPVPENGKASCEASRCGLDSCNPGYKDCDQDLSNGCEAHTDSDAQNCGACGNACGGATPLCQQGTCGDGACEPGFADCDHINGNGCEANLQTSAQNCGACGKACSFVNGSGACSGGACALMACDANYASCDGNDANGCEANLQTDTGHCGDCDTACAGDQVCANGGCRSAKLKVLLVHADPVPAITVQNQLSGTGAFSAVDLFNAMMATPTVAQLQPYDAVLVWSSNVFADTAQLGDNLASYFDGGGQVVVAVPGLAGTPSVLLGGRFGKTSNGYLLLTQTNIIATPASLGMVYEPASPLLNGVQSYSAGSGALRGQGTATNGGMVVAAWNDGNPLIVRGVVKGRNRVDLNLYPDNRSTGNGTTILKNALLYR